MNCIQTRTVRKKDWQKDKIFLGTPGILAKIHPIFPRNILLGHSLVFPVWRVSFYALSHHSSFQKLVVLYSFKSDLILCMCEIQLLFRSCVTVGQQEIYGTIWTKHSRYLVVLNFQINSIRDLDITISIWDLLEIEKTTGGALIVKVRAKAWIRNHWSRNVNDVSRPLSVMQKIIEIKRRFSRNTMPWVSAFANQLLNYSVFPSWTWISKMEVTAIFCHILLRFFLRFITPDFFFTGEIFSRQQIQ